MSKVQLYALASRFADEGGALDGLICGGVA